MTAKRFASDEALSLDVCQQVEDAGEEQEDGSRDKSGCTDDDTKPLDDAHDKVYDRSHHVGFEAADEICEVLGQGTDSKEEGDLDKYQNEAADSVKRR